MIPFIDLKTQQKHIRSKIDNRIKRVLDHGQYILGPEVKELENELSRFSNSKHVLCCSSGTDALLLALLGLYFICINFFFSYLRTFNCILIEQKFSYFFFYYVCLTNFYKLMSYLRCLYSHIIFSITSIIWDIQ